MTNVQSAKSRMEESIQYSVFSIQHPSHSIGARFAARDPQLTFDDRQEDHDSDALRMMKRTD